MANENTSNPLIRIESTLNEIRESMPGNVFVIRFEIVSEGVATVDKTLQQVSEALDAGRRIFLTGIMNEITVLIEVNCFVYSGGDLAGWTCVATAPGDTGPSGVYVLMGGDDGAVFNFISVS